MDPNESKNRRDIKSKYNISCKKEFKTIYDINDISFRQRVK